MEALLHIQPCLNPFPEPTSTEPKRRGFVQRETTGDPDMGFKLKYSCFIKA